LNVESSLEVPVSRTDALIPVAPTSSSAVPSSVVEYAALSLYDDNNENEPEYDCGSIRSAQSIFDPSEGVSWMTMLKPEARA
jgi:hypothetical protein